MISEVHPELPRPAAGTVDVASVSIVDDSTPFICLSSSRNSMVSIASLNSSNCLGCFQWLFRFLPYLLNKPLNVMSNWPNAFLISVTLRCSLLFLSAFLSRSSIQWLLLAIMM